MEIVLRPRQQDFIDDIRAEFIAGHRTVLAVAPTSFGKTICFSYISDGARSMGNRTYIMVHRKELVRQTSKSLTDNGINHGVIAAGYPELNLPIQVCSVQTLVRRLNRYRVPDLIVIDEAHHCVSDTYTQILEWASSSAILGVTATPIRTDGRGFDKIYSSLVIGPDIHTLIAEGWIATPIYYAPEIEAIDLTDVPVLAGEYHQGKLGIAMDKPAIIGSAIEHYKKYLPHYPRTVVFCVSVEAAEHMAAEFRANGIPAESIDGSMDDWTRIQIIKRVESGETRVLVTCCLVDEGFDLPLIENMIDLYPTKSLARSIQRIGRVLRIAEGKTTATIFDHVKNWMLHVNSEYPSPLIHPSIDPDRRWILEGRKKRAKTAKGTTFSTCPKCFRCFPPSDICPGCGFVLKSAADGKGRTIEQRDGELVRIDINSLNAVAASRQVVRPRVQKLERA